MYTTSNLSDVAEHFRQNATSALERAKSVKQKTVQRDLTVEARTWNQAAEFLDNVRIIPTQTR